MIDIDRKQAQAALSEVIKKLDGDTFNRLRYALEAIYAYIRQGKETEGGHQS